MDGSPTAIADSERASLAAWVTSVSASDHKSSQQRKGRATHEPRLAYLPRHTAPEPPPHPPNAADTLAFSARRFCGARILPDSRQRVRSADRPARSIRLAADSCRQLRRRDETRCGISIIAMRSGARLMDKTYCSVARCSSISSLQKNFSSCWLVTIGMPIRFTVR